MIKLAAFDFDGTLADSVDFCLTCFEEVFARFMGSSAPSREDIYQTFGMNEPGVIRHFMGGFVPEAEEYFYKLHRELHKEWCPDVYPGCRELLDFLQEKNLLKPFDPFFAVFRHIYYLYFIQKRLDGRLASEGANDNLVSLGCHMISYDPKIFFRSSVAEA